MGHDDPEELVDDTYLSGKKPTQFSNFWKKSVILKGNPNFEKLTSLGKIAIKRSILVVLR